MPCMRRIRYCCLWLLAGYREEMDEVQSGSLPDRRTRVLGYRSATVRLHSLTWKVNLIEVLGLTDWKVGSHRQRFAGLSDFESYSLANLEPFVIGFMYNELRTSNVHNSLSWPSSGPRNTLQWLGMITRRN